MDVCVVSRTGIIPKGIEYIPTNQLIVETCKPVGEARRQAISKVVTPVFCFVDDDVEIGPNWFKSLSPYINDPEVGAIWGQHRFAGLGWFDRFLSLNQGYRELKPGERFNTNNCLIRLKAAQGWKPSKGLNCFEDLDLGNYIMSQGYKVIHTPTGEAVHRKGWRRHAESSYWAGLRYREAYGNGGLITELAKRAVSPLTGVILRGVPFGLFQGWVALNFWAGAAMSLTRRK